jgi:hypothetical protein
MLADGAHIDGKELRHEPLGQPDGFVLVAGFYALLTGLAGEYQELCRGVAD